MKRAALIGAILTLIVASQLFAGSPDQRIKKILDEAELKYTIDDDGDFKMVLDMENGRSQLCYINSNVQDFQSMQIREIWSPGFKSEGPLPAAVANRLLEESHNKKIGAWETWVGSNGKTRMAVFTIKVDADCSPANLLIAVLGAVQAADSMEKEITGKDDF